MTEEQLPDPGIRIVTLVVVPGEDVTVDFSGFAYWEVKAALQRAYEVVDEAEDDNLGLQSITDEDVGEASPED